MDASDLATRLQATRSGAGWAARCPAHDDTVASLSIAEGDDQPLLVHCHAGCTPEAVMAALGLSMADLNGHPRIVAQYPYTDVHGEVLYIVQRWSPKRFTVNPTGVTDAQRTLYRREVIEYARSTGAMLYVVEGEKDVDALFAREHCATTAPHGASAPWLPQYTELLTGLNVTVVADNDPPGIARARKVYEHLKPVCNTLSIAKPAHGKDVTDLLASGYDLAALVPISESDGLTMVDADTVEPARVMWAWQDYVPFGSIALVDGDPGSAKSTLTVDLVARWSTYRPMPDGSEHAGPFTCIMVSAEDDPQTTIVPRLNAAGASLKHVRLVTGGMREDLPFNLGVDFTALREAIVSSEARILVLDPLAAFLPTGTDSKMDADVRRVLGPLAHLARQLGIAVLVVRHLTKSGTQAMYAGSGSVGFIAAARAAFLVTHDPGKSNAYRVFAPVKNNLAPMPKPLSYSVEPCTENPDVANLHWHGEAALDAQALLDAQRGIRDTEDDTELMGEAKRWLHETVAEYTGAGGMKWETILAEAKAQTGGYLKERTLIRARKGVLRKVVNPVMDTGEVVKGWFWQVVTLPTLPTLPNRDPSTEAEPFGQVGQVGKVAGWSEGPQRDDSSLDAAPWACDYPNCPVEGPDHVVKYGAPFWVVRCIDHLPPPTEDEGLSG